MTQEREQAERIAELNSLFLTLDEKGQESALTILRSLDFAQSVMCRSAEESCCAQARSKTTAQTISGKNRAKE